MQNHSNEEVPIVAPNVSGATQLSLLAPLSVFILGGIFYWTAQNAEKLDFEKDIPSITLIATMVIAVALYISVRKSIRPYIHLSQQVDNYVIRSQNVGRRYELAIRGSNDGFWDWDIPTDAVFFSSRFMSMLGYPEQDKSANMAYWYELIHPEELEIVKRAMTYTLDKRTPSYSVEYRIRCQNGEYIWVEDSGRALWDALGKAVRMAGTTKDVSNVRRVQEVLESRTNELQGAQDKIVAEIQNVKKFQKIADSSTEAILITDPEGKIVYTNQSWTILNGYTFSEVAGKTPKILKSDSTSPELIEKMWKQLISGQAYTSEEFVNKRKNGSEYQAALSIYPIREEEAILFYAGLCQDITKRKEVDKAKTEFVSLASHQLRTPLSAIRWYSEMLLSKYVGQLNEKQRQYVQEIYRGNLRMVDLVNALLNASRIDLGTFAIEPEPVNFFEVGESVLAELAPQIIQKKQRVDRIYDPNVPMIDADAKLTRIIFQNLLSNAVKYTPPGGQITLEIARHDPFLYIRIADTGYGIPVAQHDKIFQKLFRADNVRQKDTEGTGLGMYIVKAIIDAAEGSIRFDSAEDQGTTFHVQIPLTGMKKKSGTKGLT